MCRNSDKRKSSPYGELFCLLFQQVYQAGNKLLRPFDVDAMAATVNGIDTKVL